MMNLQLKDENFPFNVYRDPHQRLRYWEEYLNSQRSAIGKPKNLRLRMKRKKKTESGKSKSVEFAPSSMTTGYCR